MACRRATLLSLSLACVSFLLFPARAWPQKAPRPAVVTMIRGFVRDAASHAPMQYVAVMLEDSIGASVAQTDTDRQGKFNFTGVGSGVFFLRVRQQGYREAYQRVDLSTANTDFVGFELVSIPQEAPPALPPRQAGSQVDVKGLAVPAGAEKEFEQGRKLLLEKQNALDSIPHFRKAIELYPSYAGAYYFLGSAYMEVKKLSEAQSAFDNAIRLDSKLGVAYLGLGAALNLQGNFSAAEKPLLRGLELEPKSAPGYYELGRAYWGMGGWEKAEAPVRQAVELDPAYAAPHILLGNILLRKRDAPGALREYKESLRLAPNGPMAEPTRQMVAKLEAALKGSEEKAAK